MLNCVLKQVCVQYVSPGSGFRVSMLLEYVGHSIMLVAIKGTISQCVMYSAILLFLCFVISI